MKKVLFPFVISHLEERRRAAPSGFFSLGAD
jgi:hypothetical protein